MKSARYRTTNDLRYYHARAGAATRGTQLYSPPHARNQAHRRTDGRRRRARTQRRHPRRRQEPPATRGIEVLGIEDSFDGLIEAGPVARAQAERRRRHPAAGRHDSRHDEPRQSLRLSASTRRKESATTPTRVDRNLPPARPGRAGRDRRRRDAGDRPRVLQEGHSRRRRAQDDRQRHRRHGELLRIRHGGEFRHRRDRSPAHDGGGAPPRDGGGSDGPLCRMDRAARRRGGRRRRDSDSRNSVRPATSSRPGCASAKRGARDSASSWWQKGPRPSAGRCR